MYLLYLNTMKPILILIIIVILSSSAVAQYDLGATMMIAQNNLMYNNTIQSFVNQNIINDIAYSKTGDKKKDNRKTKPPHIDQTFLFNPSTAISQNVQQDIINRIKLKNQQVGANVEKGLKFDKPFPRYVTYLKRLGLDVQHNYDDAFTAYLLGMWRIANLTTDPIASQIQAVRQQVALCLDITKWTDTKKQEAAEYMIYDLIFANEAYEGSRNANDRKRMQQDADAVHARFLRENNLNLRHMRISENGLTVVRK